MPPAILRPELRSTTPNLTKMFRQTLLGLVVLSCFSGLAQHQVTGTIVDELGLPVNKAKITMEDSSAAIFTDFNGAFSITSENDFYWKIKVSCEGFLTETYYVLDDGYTEDIILTYDLNLKKILDEEHGFYFRKPIYFNSIDIAAFSQPEKVFSQTF